MNAWGQTLSTEGCDDQVEFSVCCCLPFVLHQCFEGPYCPKQSNGKCKSYPNAVSKCDDAVGPSKPYVFGS